MNLKSLKEGRKKAYKKLQELEDYIKKCKTLEKNDSSFAGVNKNNLESYEITKKRLERKISNYDKYIDAQERNIR